MGWGTYGPFHSKRQTFPPTGERPNMVSGLDANRDESIADRELLQHKGSLAPAMTPTSGW